MISTISVLASNSSMKSGGINGVLFLGNELLQWHWRF